MISSKEVSDDAMRAARGAALFDDSAFDAAVADPGLTMIVDRWPALPEELRQAIMAIVEDAKQR